MEDNVREIGHDEAENGDSTRRLRLAKAYLSEFYVLLEDAKNFARFSKNLSRSGTRVKIKYSNTTFMDQL